MLLQTLNLEQLPLLLQSQGSFWREQYADGPIVEQLTRGMYDQLVQSDAEMKERLLVSRDPDNAPLYSRKIWYQLLLNEDDLLSESALAWRYDPLNPAYQEGNPLYGQGYPPVWNFRVPETLKVVRLVSERITQAQTLLYNGDQIFHAPGVLSFIQNPLTSGQFNVVQVRGKPGIALWLYQSEWDFGLFQQHYGIALQAAAPTSDGLQQLVRALWNIRVRGPSRHAVYRLVSACTGVQLCLGSETVEVVETSALQTLIVTDQRVYIFPPSHQPIVQVGQVVREGQSLTDSLRVCSISELFSGDLPVLVPPSFFPAEARIRLPLLFSNTDGSVVDLGLSTGGRRIIGFNVLGDAQDTGRYFAWAAEQGLARTLDLRGPQAQTEPTINQLPQQLNALQDVLRPQLQPNLLLISGRPDRWPAAADLQQQLERHLYQAIPPHGRAILQDQNQIDQLLTP